LRRAVPEADIGPYLWRAPALPWPLPVPAPDRHLRHGMPEVDAPARRRADKVASAKGVP